MDRAVRKPNEPRSAGDLLKDRFSNAPPTNEISRLEHMDIESMHFKFLSGAGTHFKLRTLELAILCCVSTFSKSRGYCYLSKEKMAHLVRTTPPSLYQHLGRLKKRGLIEQLTKKMGRVTLYRLSVEVEDYIGRVESEITRRAELNKKPVKYKGY